MGVHFVLFIQLEKGMTMRSLWKVTPVVGKGVLFKSAKREKGIFL